MASFEKRCYAVSKGLDIWGMWTKLPVILHQLTLSGCMCLTLILPGTSSFCFLFDTSSPPPPTQPSPSAYPSTSFPFSIPAIYALESSPKSNHLCSAKLLSPPPCIPPFLPPPTPIHPASLYAKAHKAYESPLQGNVVSPKAGQHILAEGPFCLLQQPGKGSPQLAAMPQISPALARRGSVSQRHLETFIPVSVTPDTERRLHVRHTRVLLMSQEGEQPKGGGGGGGVFLGRTKAGENFLVNK